MKRASRWRTRSSEIREAIDFLRYYSAQIRGEFSNDTHRPLGPVVCISPWNFPLAIFMGQVAAALAAGNPVLAKPAEQTPLIAAQAVRILREAGVPSGAVQLLPGNGETVGAALVADPRTRAVMFTGSTEVARLINKTLSERLDPDGRPIPLIAETGGQNAMIVDSSALAEQVVADVHAVVVRFGRSTVFRVARSLSAGRCRRPHARNADRRDEATHGGQSGSPVDDVGPVIDADARRGIDAHVASMREKGRKVVQLPLPEGCAQGTFVPPTLIELDSIDELKREVFGPVLHVVRYRRASLDKLLDQIRTTGYGLTLGIHTRIDETIAHVISRAHVGNIYVNRNVIGAVVGVQPFGGEGLSGTGPKAGGALYLQRLLAKRPTGLPKSLARRWWSIRPNRRTQPAAALTALRDWSIAERDPQTAARCDGYLSARARRRDRGAARPDRRAQHVHARRTRHGAVRGIDGERRTRAIRGGARHRQHGAVFRRGGRATGGVAAGIAQGACERKKTGDATATFDAVLFEGDSDELLSLVKEVAKRPGPIVSVQGVAAGAFADGSHDGSEDYALERLLTERSVSVNTAAAGGNANLMTIG